MVLDMRGITEMGEEDGWLDEVSFPRWVDEGHSRMQDPEEYADEDEAEDELLRVLSSKSNI